MSTIARAWDEFWFRPVPPTAVSLYRIGLGLIAVCNGLLYFPNFEYWFGAQGILPMQAVTNALGGPRFGLFLFWQPDDNTLYVLLFLYILFGFTLTIGLCTRFSTACLWILAISFKDRNPFFWHSVDFMLILMLQLLFFVPAGARFSVDSALNRRFKKGEPVVQYVPWAQRLMQVQEAAVYFAAFWGKVYGRSWWHGTAVYYATHGGFMKFGLPGLLDNQLGYHFLSWGTLAIEFSLWALVWFKPFRYRVLAIGVVFHMLINWSMDLDFLEHIMVLGYINFIYPEDLEKAVGWLKARSMRMVAPATPR